jgi:hypothetical protein
MIPNEIDIRLYHIEQDVRDLEEDMCKNKTLTQETKDDLSKFLLDIAHKLAEKQNG